MDAPNPGLLSFLAPDLRSLGLVPRSALTVSCLLNPRVFTYSRISPILREALPPSPPLDRARPGLPRVLAVEY